MRRPQYCRTWGPGSGHDVRSALGASRARVVRQLVTESLVLSFAGGLLGLVLGAALLKAVPLLAPANFPRLDDIRLDGRAIKVDPFDPKAANFSAEVLAKT